jgi:hypothetical protein
MGWAAAGLAGAGIGSSIIGGIMGNNASKRARNQAVAAAEGIQKVGLPDYERMRLELEQLRVMGFITPEQEEAYLQEASQMQGVGVDPRLQKTELDAIEQLARISGSGGMDAQAMLANTQAENSAKSLARGQREANLTSAAQRGALNSGMLYAANQIAGQEGANQAALVGAQQAASANDRDLEALKAMANLGGQVTERQLGVDLKKAQAQDAINQFNTQNMIGRSTRFADRGMSAQEKNLSNAQSVANQNVGLRNSQQEYNKQLERQRYLDELERQKAVASARTGAAQIAQSGAANAGQMYGGIGQALIGAGGAIYANQKKD